MFDRKAVLKCTRLQDTPDLYVLDTGVQRGAELSADELDQVVGQDAAQSRRIVRVCLCVGRMGSYSFTCCNWFTSSTLIKIKFRLK